MLACRSPSTSKFTFERIQANGRGKAVLGSFSALDIRPLKRTAYLYSYFFFLLQVIFHWNEHALFEPQTECFARAVSGLGSRPVDCEAEADSNFRGPQEHIPSERSHKGRLPGTLLRLLPAPPTLCQLVVFGAVLLSQKLENNLEGPILWVFSNFRDEISRTISRAQEILTHLPF